MNHQQMTNGAIAADTEPLLNEISGDCIEVALEIAPQDAKSVGIKVRRSPDGEEETVIAYDAEAKQLSIDVAKSSLDKQIKYYTCCMYGGENPEVTEQAAPFELRDGEPLQLRVFIDHSIVEVFANERQCVTQHVYPTREDSLGITLFAKGGEAKVTSIDAWDMAPANPW
jgi:beta-fructofuranosidase